MFKKLLLNVVLSLLLISSAQGQWFRSPYNLQSAPATYRDSDPITSVHECTHGVNSMLRNRYGGQCFYVGDGRFFRVPRTGIRLSQVRQRVRYRGMSYNLYLVQQARDWDDTALYVFDEWVSYANGAATAVYSRMGGQNWSDVLQACEFSYYAFELVQLVPASYPNKKDLEDFWEWHADRCVKIADTAERTGVHYRSNIRPWREWLRARLTFFSSRRRR